MNSAFDYQSFRGTVGTTPVTHVFRQKCKFFSVFISIRAAIRMSIGGTEYGEEAILIRTATVMRYVIPLSCSAIQIRSTGVAVDYTITPYF